MSQPIALGAVLGGRYKVTASLLSTAEDDHVLQGEDQILRRRVSILVPSPAHESLLVDNARSLAAGAGHSGFQVLDMGQTEDSTYLVTSYAPAADLLDALLVEDDDADDYSLSDDIFGDSRSAASSAYIYEEPDPTQPQDTVSRDPESSARPAVTRWNASDYDDYDDAPAAPSVRNKLGFARKVRPDAVRSTMFDRAATRGAAAGATAATSAEGIDPTYDGDNRYESYERTEGKPGRLDEQPSAPRSARDDDATHDGTAAIRTVAPASGAAAGHVSASDDDAASLPDTAPGDDAAALDDPAAPARTAAGGSDAAASAESVGTANAAGGGMMNAAATTGAAGGIAGAAAASSANASAGHSPAGTDTAAARTEDGTREPAAGAAAGTAHAADPAGAGGARSGSTERSRKGPLRWLLLLLLIIALIAAIVLGFRGLGALTGQFGQGGAPQENAAPSGPAGSPAASNTPSPAATPQIGTVTRVTQDPNFMADTDATLGQATDGNPGTAWLSYGFSNPQFGNLVQYVGLAAQLQDPAPVRELTIQQDGGTGGQFTVYVSDRPSLDGAQQVGTGSFTGPQVSVPLSEAAQNDPHRYVLVVWNELPRLNNPIGGYPYGLRISELSVR
ncbi:hypothetical protein [Kocuria marina]|uniref:hypothetical protein n=1 Tax=Kocuria marina TaxID=223184 RepID=UPI0022E20E36|nr:hypothetical protein [Kocuria marina]